MFCPKCGSSCSPQHKFCKKCGYSLKKSSPELIKLSDVSSSQKGIPLWEQLYDEGTNLMNARRHEEALEKFQAALRINKTDSELLTNIGVVNLHLENFEEGMKWLDRSLKIDPYNPITLFNKGMFLSMETEYDKAIEAFETLLEHNPNFSQAKGLLMQTKRQKQMFGNLKLDEKGIPPKALDVFKAGIKFMHKNQLRESLNSFKSAAEMYPKFGEAYMYMGVITIMVGDAKGGLKYLDDALDVNPTLTNAWMHKGWAYDKL